MTSLKRQTGGVAFCQIARISLVVEVGKSNNTDFGIRDGIKGIGPREVLSKWGPFGNFDSVSGG